MIDSKLKSACEELAKELHDGYVQDSMLPQMRQSVAEIIFRKLSPLFAEVEKEHDKELGRWQNAIRDKVIDYSGAPDSDIDGGGCDSGDPLDLTLCEISMGFGHLQNKVYDVLKKHNCEARDDESSIDALIRFFEQEVTQLQSERTAREAAERVAEEALEERDLRTRQITSIYTALGGECEWSIKIPPQEPPFSGDLGNDSIALAESHRSELERVQKVARELKGFTKHQPSCHTVGECICGLSKLLQSAKEAGI